MTSPFLDSLRALLNSMRQTIQSIPLTLWLLFICILVIALIVLFIVFIINKKTNTGVNRDQDPPLENNNNKDNTSSDIERMPPLGGWFTEFLSRKGYVSVSDLSLSFLRAIDFIKHTLQTYNYKYQLPWFLVIGAENAGKSSLFDSGGLPLPLGKPDFSKGKANPDCRWWFLNRGIFLEPRGDFILKKDTAQSNDKGWRSLVLLLTRYRAARPLNGVVLTIPATELYGKDKLSLEQIHQRADSIGNKLTAAQRSFGLRIPVYIIITKTDILPGFKSFCGELPVGNQQNMLGWSSPYTLSTAYTKTWVEEAFQTLTNQLHQLRLDIFAHKGLSEANDGLFVFPGELASLKEGLSLYVNALFKPTAYQDGLAFRGLYFTGDGAHDFQLIPLETEPKQTEKASHVEDDDEIIAIPLPFDPDATPEPESTSSKKGGATIDTAHLATGLTSTGLKLNFVNDLFAHKILCESGLAKPLIRRLIQSNRSINIARIATAIFVVIGSYGLFNAYDKFSKSRNTIAPVLSNMNIVLKDIKIDQRNASHMAYKNADQFALYTRQIIDMMTQLQKTDLFSFFVPASWFSRLDRDLHRSLKIAFQEIIIRSIANGLAVRAQELLYLRPGMDDYSQNITQLLLPMRSPEFLLVQKFVNGMNDLGLHVKMFNSLKTTGEPSQLKALVAYTFKGELPDEFWKQYPQFRNLLRESHLNPLNLAAFQQVARSTLNILYQNFTRAIFSAQIANSLPSRLNQFLASLSQQHSHTLPNLKYLRDVSLQLAQIRSLLGEPGKTWLDQPYFKPGNEPNVLFDRIDESRLFGKEVTQYLVDQTAVGFTNLKQYLVRINAQILAQQTRGPVAPMLEAQMAQGNYPSKGILEIEKSLTSLFSENYMATPTHVGFSTSTPSGKIIYWDAKLIDVAYDMTKRYEEFSSKQISTFPAILQENLRLLARQSLHENIVSVLSQAQSFVDLPEHQNHSFSEEVLRGKINEFNETSPKFIKLLSTLSKQTVGIAFTDLRLLLINNGYWLLEHIEHSLRVINPYAVKDFSFNWWDGKTGAAQIGFSTRDTEDLKTYLVMQGRELRKLGIDFAKPVVSFLASPAINDGTGNQRLLNRWRRIVEQIEYYDKRTPGNSMQNLEDFIAKEMVTLDAKGILSAIKTTDIKNESGDFFQETLRALKKGIRSRAEILRRQQAIQSYKKLAYYFNQNLRGKFPFVTSNLSLVNQEADPEHIREFYRLYDEVGGTTHETLDQLYQLGGDTAKAVQFFQSMDVIKGFFATFLDPSSSMTVPAFDLNVDFRVNRPKEKDADLVVGWTFKPDENTKIDKTAKAKVGRWEYGNYVYFQFRWPSGDAIPAKPARDPAQPNLSIEGTTATFTFRGRWALLWALRMQAASSSDYTTMTDPVPSLLKFNVPTGSNNQATLFNTLTLSVPAVKPKTPGRVVTLPDFPAAAPDLSVEIMAFENQAVLTEGLRRPVELKVPEATVSATGGAATGTASGIAPVAAR